MENPRDSGRVLSALRSLGADVDRLPGIPKELAGYISGLKPEARPLGRGLAHRHGHVPRIIR